MNNGLLITSFTTWLTHHSSNAADDLLQLYIDRVSDENGLYLRQIPVDFTLAPRIVLEKFAELMPRVLVCCGMAETSRRLHVESQAVLNDKVLQTGIDLAWLTAQLNMTEISHDAGRFVCNTLYYRVLEYLQTCKSEHHCIFIHVPVLNETNAVSLTDDFSTIIKRLNQL